MIKLTLQKLNPKRMAPRAAICALSAITLILAAYIAIVGPGFNEKRFVSRNISDGARRRAFYLGIAGAVDDPKLALKYYEKAIETDPGYSESYRMIGLLRRDMGDIDGAIADITRSIELADRDYAYIGYLSRGDLFLKTGKYDEAIKDFDTAIKMEENYATLYNRGEAKAKSGDPAGAIRDFDRGIELALREKTPFVRILYLQRANAKFEQKNYKGAMADLDLILADKAMRDLFGAAYHMKSRIYEAMGDKQKSAENFMKADAFGFYKAAK
ncbi:MAG: tetratricopeptide repeat protein [Rickettsiales bacterium]|jgi:tetratricopeptide (TPR) repeat protein|nr:tetratricopeptide repeat protein [Rickettsiales bacterium]